MKITIRKNCICTSRKESRHYKKEVERIREMNDPRNILKEIHNALGF